MTAEGERRGRRGWVVRRVTGDTRGWRWERSSGGVVSKAERGRGGWQRGEGVCRRGGGGIGGGAMVLAEREGAEGDRR